MKSDDFVILIKKFSQQPIVATEGRHVYLWHGDLAKLKSMVSADTFVGLDLHQMVFEMTRTPRAQNEAQRLLRIAIKEVLTKLVRKGRQQIVVVTGCDLLSRYTVSLQPFFEIVSETVMIVFVVLPNETNFNRILPDYININPTSALTYIRDVLGETLTVNTP
jgi:hypothetical protein